MGLVKIFYKAYCFCPAHLLQALYRKDGGYMDKDVKTEFRLEEVMPKNKLKGFTGLAVELIKYMVKDTKVTLTIH